MQCSDVIWLCADIGAIDSDEALRCALRSFKAEVSFSRSMHIDKHELVKTANDYHVFLTQERGLSVSDADDARRQMLDIIDSIYTI